jgi:hypothetical protein
MSLGWQCESALVPRTAKPIEINDHGKSMLGLKAIVYSQKEKILNKSDHNNFVRRKTFSSDKNKTSVPDPKRKGNRGNSDTNDKEDEVYKSLQKKAALYQELLENKSNLNIDEHIVVDFHLKSNTDQSIHYVKNNEQDGGILNEKIITNNNNDNNDVGDSNIIESSSSSLSQQPISDSARVKSQWERSSNAKRFLEQVHEEFINERNKSNKNDFVNGIESNYKTKSSKEIRKEILLKKQKLFNNSDDTS